MKVSCVIPTRGDVDLAPIHATLQWCDDVIVADGSSTGIYARYAAIARARHPVIVTQDDDLLVSGWPALLDAYEPGKLIVSYPEPWDVPWVARGAIFDADLPERAFDAYLARYPRDRLFTHQICDGVFSLLTETVVYDFGSEDLPHGFDEGRVSTSPGWYDGARPELQRRVAQLLS